MTTQLVSRIASCVATGFIVCCTQAIAADSETQSRLFVRSYVTLRMTGCNSTSLQEFARVLSGVTNKNAFAIGLTINGLGWAALNNYELYRATYDMLVVKDPNSTYAQYLGGDSVTENCNVCTGPSGRAMQSCEGCGGTGKARGADSIRCAKCGGSGFTPVWCGTCRGLGHTFSPAKSAQTFRVFVRNAEDRLGQIYGDLGKYLSSEELARYTSFKGEELLGEVCHDVRVQLFQVASDGALAYVSLSQPEIPIESGFTKPLIFIRHLAGGLVDGDKWEGKLYLVGTYRYTTKGKYAKTVKMFSADRGVAAKILAAKTSGADSRDSDSDSDSDGRSADAEGSSMGTGWLTAHGYIVTCYHVVKSHRRVFIKSQKLEKRTAKLIQSDRVNDIAILRPDRLVGLPSGLPLAVDAVGIASKVFTLGYPQTQLLGNSLKFTEGTVSALRGLHDDPRCLQISVPVQAGNSGGPLLNTNGEVVGVIVSKLAAVNVFAWTGDLPQNVNFSVRSDYVKALLGALEKREHPVLEAKKADMEELVSRSSDSVVMVIAE